MLRAELPRSLVNCKFVKGWVSNPIATASRWPSMAPHRGASGRATSVYSTPWPPTCSGALLTRCTIIEVAPLPAFTVDVAIQDAPGRLSHACTRQRRRQHRDHTKEAVVSQQWSTGSSSTHSPALSATCIYLLRGQKVANYHGKGNSTLSRKDCDLVLLSCTSGTADCARAVKATCAWQFSLGDIRCTNKMHQLIWRQAAMLEREDRRDLHWRQPWTSDSLALGSEKKTRNHPIGRATDIFPW